MPSWIPSLALPRGLAGFYQIYRLAQFYGLSIPIATIQARLHRHHDLPKKAAPAHQHLAVGLQSLSCRDVNQRVLFDIAYFERFGAVFEWIQRQLGTETVGER